MVIALGAVLQIAQDVVIPLVLAVIISFIVSPIIRKLEKIKFPRTLAIIVVMILFFGLFYLVGLIIYASAKSFLAQLPKYQDRFASIIDLITLELRNRFPLQITSIESLDWASTIRNYILSFSNSLMGFIRNLVIISFFMIFLLSEKRYFKHKIEAAFHNEMSDRISNVLTHINEQIARYLSVKFFISLVTGIIVWFCLAVVGLDFPIIWGTLAFLFNFIPNIGSAIIIVLTILMSFIQFYPQWGPIIGVSVTMMLVQLIMGNIIDPRLQGKRLDLSPFLILVSLFFWGWLWGIIGMFLAVPLTAIIKITCQNIPFLYPISIIMSSGKAVHSKKEKKTPTKESDEGNI